MDEDTITVTLTASQVYALSTAATCFWAASNGMDVASYRARDDDGGFSRAVVEAACAAADMMQATHDALPAVQDARERIRMLTTKAQAG